MKKSIAMKWVDALRSGKYKQGHNQLYDKETNGYCCLGVLCKINKIKITDEVDYIEDIRDQKKLSIKSVSGRILGDFNCNTSLADLNDSGNYAFDEIADIIQLFYEEL